MNQQSLTKELIELHELGLLRDKYLTSLANRSRRGEVLSSRDLKYLESELPVRQKKSNKKRPPRQTVEVDAELRELLPDHFPFQLEGVSWIEKKNGRALIGDEPGLGKTIQALGFLDVRCDIRPAVVLCPSVVKYNWYREAKKWTGSPAYVLEGETGSPLQDRDGIYVLNYDILRNKRTRTYTCRECGYLRNSEKDRKRCRKCLTTDKPQTESAPVFNTGWVDYLRKLKPQCAILDEIHILANVKSFMTQDTLRLCRSIPNVVGLSGTPFLNRPSELYMPLKLLKPSMFPNEKVFKKRYCGPEYNGFGTTYNGASNKKELSRILREEVMLRRRKKEVLKDLPDKTRTTLAMEIPRRHEYWAAENDFIRWARSNDMDVSAAGGLVKMTALRKLISQAKLKPSIQWITDFLTSGEKLVVMCHHKVMVRAIKKHFGKRCVFINGDCTAKQKERAKNLFQLDPEIDLMVGNIKAAGIGTTLTAASNLVFLEYPWTPGELIQAEDRIHRIGQDNACTIYSLVVRGSIEEEFVALLNEKMAMFSGVIDDMPTAIVIGEFFERLKKRAA